MKMATRLPLPAVALLIGCLMLTGCGKGSSAGGTGGFNAAPPELKAAWETAVAADKTNDYVTAALGYKGMLLQREQLSPSQVKAVEEASGKLYQRLVEGIAKGDPTARQALSQLQPAPPGPRPEH
jgi:hypothetical protein